MAKRAIYSLTPEILKSFLILGNKLEMPNGEMIECIDGIPPNAKVENSYFNQENQTYSLVVSHPIFDSLKDNVTSLKCEYKETQSKKISIDEMADAIQFLRKAINNIIETDKDINIDQELKFIQKWENKFDTLDKINQKNFADEQKAFNLKHGLPLNEPGVKVE